MNIEELREYCLAMEGVTEKTPFGKFARRFESVLVFYVLDHMFCLLDMDDFSYITVRGTAEEVEELRTHHSAIGSHRNMSPKYWMRLDFGGDLTDTLIHQLVRRSYEVVREKYTPKMKRK